MTRPAPALPDTIDKVAIINPTSFLGNILIAGDLIRRYIDHCLAQGQEVLLVLDKAHQPLLGPTFQDIEVIWYPRSAIRKSRGLTQLRIFLRCLRQIRRFRADLAFNLEEDSVSSRLTQCSRARFRLGCSPARHKHGYEHVLPIEYEHRRAERGHRWHSYHDVFNALGFQHEHPAYLTLNPAPLPDELPDTARQLVNSGEAALVGIHSGATKAYKRWPGQAYVELCKQLINAGYTPVLIGAGSVDEEQTTFIRDTLVRQGYATDFHNLCNQLPLPQLASFLRHVAGFIGNDSGPFHLASSLGVPGVVLFGPSNSQLWGPLGDHSRVLQHTEQCETGCSRRHCRLDYACLTSITPEEVFNTLAQLLDNETQA